MEVQSQRHNILLEAHEITKRYGGVQALSAGSIQVASGEVHALLGENGSGKSTLMKVLAGQVIPDSGIINVSGERRQFSNPHQAIQVGISMVAQEISLIPELSVAENIMLGRQKRTNFGTVDWRRTRQEAQEVLNMLGVHVDPGRRVSTLQIDLQQVVEIARSIATGAKVIILDEPTSSLSIEQTEQLFRVVRKLSEEKGTSFILISHKINEILNHCDFVTILRDGATVGETPVSAVNAQQLVNMMVGREVGEFYYKEQVEWGPPLFEIDSVSVPSFAEQVSLTVRRGEIVGLYGLESAGHKELLESCFGMKRRSGGRVVLEGEELNTKSPEQCIARGIAYVPADRKLHGGVLSLSIAENLLMVKNSSKPRYMIQGWREKNRQSASIYERLRVKSRGREAPLGSLSGGNQQKVVFGKWLEVNPKLFLLDDPTRGIDIPSKTEIYHLFAELTRQGSGIVIISSDLPELLSLADRVVVMFRGKVMKTLQGKTTEEEVMYYATGNA